MNLCNEPHLMRHADAANAVPPPALLAEVTRGPNVESRHFGHVAVVHVSGRVEYQAGNPEHLFCARSSLKPLQALAGVAAGTASTFGFSAREIAVTCASHAAEPRHREAVSAILERIGAGESDLRCGPHPVPHLPTRDALIREGRQPTPIYSNCSGKHAGMLALARVLDAPLSGYWEHEHPVQREVRRVVELFGRRSAPFPWGLDGCGVPTYFLPLSALALAFARLGAPEDLPARDLDAAGSIIAAMTEEPEMVRGEGGFDSVLMRALPGAVVCKSGAEGCHAAALPRLGLGIAVKVEDGSARPIPPVMLALLRRLGACGPDLPASLAEYAASTVQNTRGEPVGEIRCRL
jgi:L-asparaginase II